MFSAEQYELIDFGRYQKLEKFAGHLVVRPCPVATSSPHRQSQWLNVPTFQTKDNRKTSQQSERGTWVGAENFPAEWILTQGSLRFKLKPTPFGHLGVFPEQATNWDWIERLPINLVGKKAINLFAYTGGTTLALASRGVEVTHVDSAKNVVNWARENAAWSKLGDKPIRWIVEDVVKFVEREIRRGNQYEIVVADPPSFGRGPKGEVWKIQQQMEQLLQHLSSLTKRIPIMIVLSCHTPGFESPVLEKMSRKQFDLVDGVGEKLQLRLSNVTKGIKEESPLVVGDCFRWYRNS